MLSRSTSPGVVPSPTPPIYTPSMPRLVSSMPELRFRQTRILGPQTEKRRKYGHIYTYFEAVKLRMAPVLFVCYRLLCLDEQHCSIQATSGVSSYSRQRKATVLLHASAQSGLCAEDRLRHAQASSAAMAILPSRPMSVCCCWQQRPTEMGFYKLKNRV